MKTLKVILGLLLLCIATSSYAQLSGKVSKPAKQEAKRLKKEGWKVFPGALPLEYQIERAYQIQNDMMQKYVIGNAQSVGQFVDAARLQACPHWHLIRKIQYAQGWRILSVRF